MKSFYSIIGFFLSIALLISCSKKNIPSKANTSSVEYTYDSSNVIKNSEEVKTIPPPRKKTKAVFPKTITVNDSAATKSVDGRMYYDIQGRRYWKNFKDGKYYLFDKSMYDNTDFKPPVGGN